MFRSRHATFLHDMAELLDDARLRVLAATYDALADSWRALADLAACEDHGAGVDVVQRIQSLEHRGVSLTEAWLAQNA
jgi:hypothetical protein